MKTILWPIERVKPYERNPRKYRDAIDHVAGLLKAFRFRQPIVVDKEGVIVVGHVRYFAAQKLELKKVPVHVAADLTPEEIKAYRIADNQAAQKAEWDDELLALELRELGECDYDLAILGFDDAELAKLVSGELAAGLTDPDDVPAAPDEAVTRRGDVWHLGPHRLLCGDSSIAQDVDRLLAGESVQLVNTDPPYNVKVEPRSNNAIAAGLSTFWNDESKGGNHQKMDLAAHPEKAKATHKKLRAKDRPLANDFISDADFEQLLKAWFDNIGRVLDKGRAFYIWGGFANVGNYPQPIKNAGLFFSQAIIWVKNQPVLTRKDFMTTHEWCFYGWKAGAGHQFFGPNNIRDVWEVKKVHQSKMVHLTEKPVELAVRAMQYSSRAAERVLDLFGGSGSTLIAAEQTGRHARLMELDPLYCDVIVKRWEEFTGQKARREGVRDPSARSQKKAAAAAGRKRAKAA